MAMKDTVDTVNTSIRTLLALLLVGGLSTAGYLGYTSYQSPKRELAQKEAALEKARGELAEKERALETQRAKIATLSQEVTDLEDKVDRLEIARRLLKVDHRVAELRVLEQRERPEDGRLISTVEFVEVNDEGAPLGEPQQVQIEGQRVYVAGRVAQFQDRYVEAADLNRGTSICQFERIFGEFQEPQHGFPLDKAGTRPTAYARGGKISPFEQRIWDDFWEIAHDPQLAEQMGIRVVQGEAPYVDVRAGATYRVTLRAAGGLSIVEEKDGTPPRPGS